MYSTAARRLLCRTLLSPTATKRPSTLSPLVARAFSKATEESSSTTSTIPPPTIDSMSILKRIQSDLVDTDVNHDGRIDFEELKLLLGNYPEAFSPDDIERIGELFYVGQAGSSVRHTTFLRGIQHVLNGKENPLRMESLDDNRCYVSPEEVGGEGEDLYDVQAQFDQSLKDYVCQVSTEEEKDPSK